MPSPKPQALTASQLTQALGLHIIALAAALGWLGWRSDRQTVNGKQRMVWVPPGVPIKPKPRGGTRIYAY